MKNRDHPSPHFNDGNNGAFWGACGFGANSSLTSGEGEGEGRGSFSFYSVQDCRLSWFQRHLSRANARNRCQIARLEPQRVSFFAG